MSAAPAAFCTPFLGSVLDLRRRTTQERRVHCAAISSVTPRAEGGNRTDGERKNAEEVEWKTGKVRAPRRVRGAGRVGRGNVRIQGKYYKTQVLPPQPPGLRVTAGTARGRRIKSPNVYLRPMMGKVREALFSMLEMFEVIRSDGATLDLFAGSGSIGIESLSRGMGRAVFVDAAEECTDTIAENLESCRLADRGQAVRARVENFLERGPVYNNQMHYDLITITPPYEEVDYSELMAAVSNSQCVGEGTFVVVEYPVELRCLPPVIGNRLIGIRNRRYGRTVLALYACQPHVDVDPRPGEFIDVKRK